MSDCESEIRRRYVTSKMTKWEKNSNEINVSKVWRNGQVHVEKNKK